MHSGSTGGTLVRSSILPDRTNNDMNYCANERRAKFILALPSAADSA